MTKQTSLILIIVLLLVGCGQQKSNSQDVTTQTAKVKTQKIATSEMILSDTDKTIFAEKKKQFSSLEVETKGDLIAEIAKSFLGTPYVAKTLEIDSTEKLVINLHEFDCTTFVESCTALASTIQNNQSTVSDYAQNLESLRYRDGIRDGYTSRLHYFSEWIKNNVNKGLVQDITKDAKGEPLPIHLSFMSEHSDLYPLLKGQDSLIAIVANAEKRISNQQFFFIPEEKLRMVEPFLFDGDIVAITTNINGLDVSHTGFVLRKNDRVHLLHASSAQKKVVLSEIPLVDYLKKGKSTTGVIVLRATNEAP